MAASHVPPDPGIPPRTFKDVLASSSQSATVPPHPALDHQPHESRHKGSPAIVFQKSHIQQLSSHFHWTLIGKFSHGYNKVNPKLGRPSVVDLTTYFESLDLHGDFQLGLLDNRHLLFQLKNQEDFLRFYFRPVWYMRGHPMRIFKWSSQFHVDRESSIIPVWITLPRLPVHFFERNALFVIAGLLGYPLRMDSATAQLKRPSLARVQIELDLLKERHSKIWISTEGEDGFWQTVEFENIPDYCQHCWHVGHSIQSCHVYNPELKHIAQPQQRQKYVVKQPQQSVQPSSVDPLVNSHVQSVNPPNLHPDKEVLSEQPQPSALPVAEVQQLSSDPLQVTAQVELPSPLGEETPVPHAVFHPPHLASQEIGFPFPPVPVSVASSDLQVVSVGPSQTGNQEAPVHIDLADSPVVAPLHDTVVTVGSIVPSLHAPVIQACFGG